MYAMIHSAEIVHHQQAAETARNLERARIRNEQEVAGGTTTHLGLRARLVAALHHGHAAAQPAGAVAAAH